LVFFSLLIVNARDPTMAAEAESYCAGAWDALAILSQKKSALVPDELWPPRVGIMRAAKDKISQ
jgi:hypothetical protein